MTDSDGGEEGHVMSVGSLEGLRVGGLQGPEFCPNIYAFGNGFFPGSSR